MFSENKREKRGISQKVEKMGFISAMQLSTGIETQKERTLAMLEDKEFMCWLFERYGRFIWYTVKKFCRRTDLWEDIVQESLLRLLSCTPRLRNLSEQKLTGYIAVTTRNTTYAFLWKEEKNQEKRIQEQKKEGIL